MQCDIQKMLQRQFYFFGTYFMEEAILDRWTTYAGESEVVFDIGANAGIYSLAAAAANPQATVNAFEPTPQVASHLRSTVSTNSLSDRIRVHELAVGAVSGTAALNFFSGERDDNEGMNFVSATGVAVKSCPIAVVSLDDFCRRRGIERLDLVKIDVQGAEADVLTGAANLLSNQALGTLFLELNWSEGEKCSATRVIELLRKAGYQFTDPRGARDPQPAGPWLRSLTDVIAITQ
ncbi:MAG: FkbM family methyltransferase [Chthoniobacterales bacterium]